MALEGFRFRRGESFIHRSDPRAKFLLSFAFMAMAIAFVKLKFLLLILALQLAILANGRCLKDWIRSLKGLVPLIALIFAAQVLVSWSWVSALTYSVRFVAVTSTMSWFLLTTSPDDLGLSLEQVGLPSDISFAFTMAIRFVPVISYEFQSVYDAQRSRGLELEKGSFVQRIRKYVPIIVPVFIETIRRTYEIADAMEVRAFGAKPKRTRLNVLVMRPSDWAISLVAVLLLLGTVFLQLSNAKVPWINA
ncbi:MAG: energy-coupling factor transporter transmembrane protein EcfT [Candidatus Brockarchaeota archaeon]|nr:energy-coupling factor transporter transmembrane protein EcfT [Candidatus Brockarchaeota archaeon]